MTTIPLAFGLAFDIVKAFKKSSYAPAPRSLEGNLDLFSDLRLYGFAAALTSGLVGKLVVVGGNEARYPKEFVESGNHALNRAWAIREMLVHDCGVESERVEWSESTQHTIGNVGAILAYIKNEPQPFTVITNLYHIPRAMMDFDKASHKPNFISAEALWVYAADDCLEREKRLKRLLRRFGGGNYAQRTVREIEGAADKLADSYVS